MDSSSATAAATASTGQKDLSSVLAHIETLQKQLAEKTAELTDVKQREESARTKVEQLNELNAKLTEAKREAMREDFNNKVRGWIQGLDPKQVPDAVKQEFLDGAERFVDKGNETGAWKVRFIFFEFPFCLQPCPSVARLLLNVIANTPAPGPVQRVFRAPESGQHHPEADGGLQRAEEDGGGRAVWCRGQPQAEGDGALDNYLAAVRRVGAVGGDLQ